MGCWTATLEYGNLSLIVQIRAAKLAKARFFLIHLMLVRFSFINNWTDGLMPETINLTESLDLKQIALRFKLQLTNDLYSNKPNSEKNIQYLSDLGSHMIKNYKENLYTDCENQKVPQSVWPTFGYFSPVDMKC